MALKPLIVLTREHEDNLPLLELLHSRGLETLEYPCIAARNVPYAGAEIVPGRWLRNYDIISFTSKRGVAGLQEAAPHLRRSGQLLAAVGQATAKSIEDIIGRKPDIVASVQTGLGLAAAIKASAPAPQLVLHIRGDKANPSFKKTLEAAGYQVDELRVYETFAPAVQPLLLERQAIIVLASPSAARCFFSANRPDDGRFRFLAIGPVTASCLTEAGVSEVITATEPDAENIIRKIEPIFMEELPHES